MRQLTGFFSITRGTLRALLKRLQYALLAVAMIPAAVAQESPVDPVTGMAIPILPGQFYLKSLSGCWIITEEPLGRALENSQFIGSCTYGVVNGLGFRAPVQNQSHPQPLQSYEYRPFRAELGDLPAFYEPWGVYAPRTSTHDLLEKMNLKHRTIESIESTSPLFKPEVINWEETLVYHTSWKNRARTDQWVEVRKQKCPSSAIREDWLTLSVVNDYIGRGGMQEKLTEIGVFSKQDMSRLVDFCLKQVARLKKETGGRKLDFYGLKYGYFFAATTSTSSDSYSADGRSVTKQTFSRTWQVCSDPGTLTGCERVWQTMLAPLVTRFDDLKRQEMTLMMQHRAEQQERFAPLAKAWRDKILAATGAPAGSN